MKWRDWPPINSIDWLAFWMIHAHFQFYHHHHHPCPAFFLFEANVMFSSSPLFKWCINMNQTFIYKKLRSYLEEKKLYKKYIKENFWEEPQTSRLTENHNFWSYHEKLPKSGLTLFSSSHRPKKIMMTFSRFINYTHRHICTWSDHLVIILSDGDDDDVNLFFFFWKKAQSQSIAKSHQHHHRFTATDNGSPWSFVSMSHNTHTYM